MSTAPQPPRGPAAPPPPRTGSHILTIALLFLALIIVVSLATVWVGLRFLARGVSVTVYDNLSSGKEGTSAIAAPTSTNGAAMATK